MSSLTPFSFDSREIRVLTIAGDPWFVAKDVAEALEYSGSSNPARLFASVPDEWKGVNPIHTLGGIQEMLTLSEPGLYFFLGRSDKPKALPFQKWAAGEVFPAIRKTGGYALPGASASMVAAIADLRAQLEMIQKLARWAEPMLADLEVQVGRATAPAIRSNSYRPRPPRRAAPLDPWEPQIRAYADRRLEVTSAEVLRHLGIEDNDQTQNHKNRIAKLLNQLGFVNSMVKRNGRVMRIWRRHHHA